MASSSSTSIENSILRRTLLSNQRENHEGPEKLLLNNQDEPSASSSSNVDYGNVFQINRSSIRSIAKENQAHELHSLEVSVYDQDELERGIIEQMDRALEEEKNNELMKQYDIQIKSLREDISAAEESLQNIETSLKNLPVQDSFSNINEALLLRRKIDNELSNIQSLKSKEKALVNQRKLIEKRKNDTEEEYGDYPNGISEEEDSLVCQDIGEKLMNQNEETEKQKMIRLGQMTPFGTTLTINNQSEKPDKGIHFKFEKSEPEKFSFVEKNYDCSHEDRSMIQLPDLNLPGPSGLHTSDKLGKVIKSERKLGKKCSILKKGILHPKKKRKKENLGSEISCEPIHQRRKPGLQPSETNVIDFESSGSEYIPSGNEESSDEREHVKAPRQKRKGKVRKESDDEWRTDDSDWEYSDDESIKRKRKRGKKVIDDGNLEDYLDRLKTWEREEKAKRKADDDENDRKKFHELEGGLKIPEVIWNRLFSYQKVGVQWMWELHQQKCGGILGDEMGLGKTVQVAAYFAGLASSPHLTSWSKGLGPSLIVCPTTVLHQWVKEFHTWWPPIRIAILHDSGSFTGKGGKAALVKSVRGSSGVLVTSYEGLARLADDLSLLEWHLVVLDEGHVIRNPDARVTLAAKRLRTPHRLLLSGSPLQNNLRELWSLFDFIFPGKLGTLPVFMAEFAIPITQGGYSTASQIQVITGYKCATVLKDTIAPYLLRRMKADVKDHINLPTKNEQVLFCKLTDQQRDVYRQYLQCGDVDKILTGTLKVFVGLINLRKICNHPDLYTGGPKLFKWDKEEDLPEEERYGFWKKSGKMIVVENLLRIWHRQGHRVLLFTQGRQMMCILENFIRHQSYNYLKLDGATSISSRQPMINEFNQNPYYFIFLLTTKVGGIGVNLTGANRVLIYDPDWNPATDTQARERAWRPGQSRHVTVYRLVTAGTIEEKIYHRQIFKQFLTDRVLRDPKRRRFFKSNDLYELFTLYEDGDDLGRRGAKTETSAIFAGTGSEIKMTTSPSKSKRKVNPEDNSSKKKENVIHQKKSSCDAGSNIAKGIVAEDNSLGVVRKMNKIKKTPDKKDASHKETFSGENNAPNDNSFTKSNEEKLKNTSEVTFSEEKIQMMKKLAQNLSLKIAKQMEEGKVRIGNIDSDSSNLESTKDDKSLSRVDGPSSSQNMPKKSINREIKSSPELNKTKESKSHSGKSKKKRHKKRKECMFEGEHVSHLVGCEQAKMTRAEKNAEEEEHVNQSQDDYVLKKLFAKSGLQTALHHDIIMEGGEADYALVEGEAERVAHEAVKALKESRRNCWTASSGVPTWTGQNGRICQNASSSSTPKMLRFGNKKKQPRIGSGITEKPSSTVTSASNQEDSLSSTEILAHIRNKDSLLEYFRWKKTMKDRGQEGNDTNIEDSLRSSGVSREQADLLDDIRAFVAYGAAQDGKATTQEILNRFNPRLPPGATPQLFKSMLKSVCNFTNQGVTGTGLWRLKPEFCD